MSLLLRPYCGPGVAAQAGFVAAVAVAAALGGLAPPKAQVSLKWPNDVLVNGRKVSGVLVESTATAGAKTVDWMILGIGINLDSFPTDSAYPASSLAAEGFVGVDAAAALQAVTVALQSWLGRWRDGGFPPIRTAWLKLAHGLGGNVVVRLEEETLTGRFADLDETGALLLVSAQGARRVAIGDVFPAAAG